MTNLVTADKLQSKLQPTMDHMPHATLLANSCELSLYAMHLNGLMYIVAVFLR